MPRREFEPGIEGARALDAADELGSFRRQFELPKQQGRTLTYLCGHSLGLMPRRARRYVGGELERWAQRGVDGHFAQRPSEGWFDYHERFSEPLAALIGAKRDEVVAMNSLTVNLHLMLVSFFQPTKQRYKILIERDAFPSDRYAVQSQLRYHGLNPEQDLLEIAPDTDSRQLNPERLRALLEAQGEHIALILLPGVQYLSGERLDIGALTSLAQGFGCRIGFDLAHAIGNVPVELHDAGPDFAVWCSYKYLNGGPGAVGGCFVHRRWAHDRDLPRFAGWWGHDPAQRLKMPRDFVPMTGAEGWQLSNPPILSLAPLAASLELFQQAGLPKLRRKSERLTRYLEHLLHERLGERVTILTPADSARRGCQLSLQLNPAPRDPASVVNGLRRAGVIADLREPNVLRL
ncbi:MAG TPA: kynureninase, partial [Gammaproteobacteria bacterium]|nr:kynureninase [Gammaproteobacteria bacterium]